MKIKTLIVLVILMVINTIGLLLDLSIWWLLGSEAILFLAYYYWKAWSHPVAQLENQAMYMNWKLTRVDKSDGYRNNVYKKDGIEALVSFTKESVFIVKPFEAGPFKDFIEIDRFIENRKRDSNKVKSESLAFSDFEEEISKWPREQAQIAILMLSALLSGEVKDLQKQFGDLTVGHFEYVGKIFKRIIKEGEETEMYLEQLGKIIRN